MANGAPMITHPIAEDTRLAVAFLEFIRDQPERAPWAAIFDEWAATKGVTEEMARDAKLAILRLRMFSNHTRTRSGRR
jgi:hypothetical protein